MKQSQLSTQLLSLGVAGDEGSFSEEAALLYEKQTGTQYDLHYLIDMEGVLHALANAKIDLGILPVVNTNGGLVRAAFDAMGKYSFRVVDELWLPVRQCCLMLKTCSPEQITSVISHRQGLLQCQRYLEQHFKQATQHEWVDTAKAARDLAAGILAPTTAIIASSRAAALFNLTIYAQNIHDNEPNETAFIVVKNRSSYATD